MNPAQKLENCQFADLIWDFFWGAYIQILSLCEKQANVFKLFKDIYHAPSFIVVQVHLLTQRTTPLASIDKLTSQLVAENDVVGAAAPFLCATSENVWLRNQLKQSNLWNIKLTHCRTSDTDSDLLDFGSSFWWLQSHVHDSIEPSLHARAIEWVTAALVMA